METLQRWWPTLQVHLSDCHPELSQQDAILAGSFAGLLTAAHFQTDDADANRHRTKTAAALHQLSKRNLPDADIEDIVTKVAQKIQVRKTQRDAMVKMVQQLRDYLDYADILNAPTPTGVPAA